MPADRTGRAGNQPAGVPPPENAQPWLGWDSDRFHEPGCDDRECRGCKHPDDAPADGGGAENGGA